MRKMIDIVERFFQEVHSFVIYLFIKYIWKHIHICLVVEKGAKIRV